ncbi:MAG TPA: MBL fold metallo-hydrolase [Vicinamibacterales bacterium]|nr:MBL fold metallo-hydrolase [Vicinamibacterales bacterium]
MTVRVTLLGTGTSHGVPMIGCDCATCRSTDPRDRRSRPSIVIERTDPVDGPPSFRQSVRSVLVDTSTDLRQQALTHNLRRVDAILFTHSHADHILGLDEVRRFNVIQKSAIPAYGDARTVADLRQTFSYIFNASTPQGGGLPKLTLSTVAGPFTLGGLEIQPVPLLHGARPILGYRFGSFAYLTDCNVIPDGSWPLLQGVRTLVLDALREKPHPTHFNVTQAIDAARRIGADRTYFTHVCHDLGYVETCARLPDGIELAYDGQVIELSE